MAKPSNYRPLTQLFVLCIIGILRLGGSQDLVLRKTNTPKSETRGDLRCGKGYLAPNGLPAKCPMENPCCSKSKWCGNTDSYCKCGGCERFFPKALNVTSGGDTLPDPLKPLKQLEELLDELSGPIPSEEDKEANEIDPLTPHQSTIGEVGELKKGTTKKRFIKALAGRGLPFLSKFGAGLFKNTFSQLVNRPTKNSYTKKILKKFIPRVLANSNLADSAISHSIQSQVKNNDYNSAMAVIESNSENLRTEDYVSKKYQKVLSENTENKKLVRDARHIIKALISTIDSILSQRLKSLYNMLSSLFTSLLESLRILLEEYHNGHKESLKKLLSGVNNTMAKIDTLTPPSDINLYALLAAILVLQVLIFPCLVVVRGEITNHHTKVFHSRCPDRSSRRGNEIVETPFLEERLTEANVLAESPPSLNVARSEGSKSRFSRGKGASNHPSV